MNWRAEENLVVNCKDNRMFIMSQNYRSENTARKRRPQTADLENADFENTDLENADLENTDLENVVCVLY